MITGSRKVSELQSWLRTISKRSTCSENFTMNLLVTQSGVKSTTAIYKSKLISKLRLALSLPKLTMLKFAKWNSSKKLKKLRFFSASESAF